MAKVGRKIEWIETETGCFYCTSHKYNASGYGYISVRGKVHRLHKYIFEECFGEVPPKMVIRHKCDNRFCFNPEHLELGTHEENMRDMVERNRSLKGSKSPFAVIDEEKARLIKQLIRDKVTCRAIAERLNVKVSLVFDISAGRTWKHID